MVLENYAVIEWTSGMSIFFRLIFLALRLDDLTENYTIGFFWMKKLHNPVSKLNVFLGYRRSNRRHKNILEPHEEGTCNERHRPPHRGCRTRKTGASFSWNLCTVIYSKPMPNCAAIGAALSVRLLTVTKLGRGVVESDSCALRMAVLGRCSFGHPACRVPCAVLVPSEGSHFRRPFLTSLWSRNSNHASIAQANDAGSVLVLVMYLYINNAVVSDDL